MLAVDLARRHERQGLTEGRCPHNRTRPDVRRTRDGLEAARARGRTGGQKPKLGIRQARLAREMYEAGELTVTQIAAEFGVTRPTIYRHLDHLDRLESDHV